MFSDKCKISTICDIKVISCMILCPLNVCYITQNKPLNFVAEISPSGVNEKAQHQVKAAARTLADNTRVSEPLALNALLDYICAELKDYK